MANSDLKEIKHEAQPGFVPAYYGVLAAGVIYLGYIFFNTFTG